MDKKEKSSHIKSRHLLAVMTMVCIALITLTSANILPIQPVREAAGLILTPIQTGINKIGTALAGAGSSFQTRQELSAENKELKEQVQDLTEQNTLLTEGQTELSELRALYETDQTYADYPKVEADVIGKETGNWYRSFTINRGAADGVDVDMNVLADGGLCGIVTNAGRNWATVRSIIDDSSSVSAMTVSGTNNCIVSGDLTLYDEGKMSLSQLNADNEVAEGTRLVTSNISDKYLPGILIGYIDELTEDTNHLTNTGKVSPAVDFRSVSKVLVITQKKQSTADESGTEG